MSSCLLVNDYDMQSVLIKKIIRDCNMKVKLKAMSNNHT